MTTRAQKVDWRLAALLFAKTPHQPAIDLMEKSITELSYDADVCDMLTNGKYAVVVYRQAGMTFVMDGDSQFYDSDKVIGDGAVFVPNAPKSTRNLWVPYRIDEVAKILVECGVTPEMVVFEMSKNLSAIAALARVSPNPLPKQANPAPSPVVIEGQKFTFSAPQGFGIAYIAGERCLVEFGKPDLNSGRVLVRGDELIGLLVTAKAFGSTEDGRHLQYKGHTLYIGALS